MLGGNADGAICFCFGGESSGVSPMNPVRMGRGWLVGSYRALDQTAVTKGGPPNLRMSTKGNMFEHVRGNIRESRRQWFVSPTQQGTSIPHAVEQPSGRLDAWFTMWASSSFCVFTLNLIERKTSMKRFLTYLWQEDEGQDLVEYALLVVLVALAAVTAMSSLASNISSAFANASAKLTTTT